MTDQPPRRHYTRRGDVSGIICWSPRAGAWQYWNGSVLRDSSDDLAELTARWPLADVHAQADLFGPNVAAGIAENGAAS